jgi:high affinity cGMP-specific 3',5'-cyclic phosphodiesterase 9
MFAHRRLNEASQKTRKSLVEADGSSDGDEIIPRSQSGISVRSRRSIPSQKSNSRNSVDEEPILIAAELHDLPEGSESGDSETATEVDVSDLYYI